MKRRRRWAVLIVVLFGILGIIYLVVFGSKGKRSEQDKVEKTQIQYSDETQGNILIAYFTAADNMPQEGLDTISSASIKEVDGEIIGNTEYAAMRIQDYVHGDLFSIQTNRLYSRNYTLSTIQALGEQILNVKPRLVSHVEDFNQYDIIFLGYPAWWMDVPIAIESFLDEYDFSDKIIIPFTTHVSSGLGDTVEKIQGLIPEAEVMSGISIQENMLNSDRLDEILEENLGEYIVR